MKFKRSLHFRIFISYAVFGIVFGLILFLFLFLSYEQLEEELITEKLIDEMAFYMKAVESNPSASALKTTNLSGYHLPSSQSIPEFPFLVALSTGIHEVYYNDYEYAVNVVEHKKERFYLIYNITDFEKQEHRLSIIFSTSILLAVLASIWYGYLLANRVLAPVKHLANELKNISADNLKTRLSPEFAQDEVGSLANSFDIFLERIQTFVDREKNFAADASHELRTPISVIQSTTELLLSTNELSKKDNNRLLRIQRAVKNITLSISALLTLSREPLSTDTHQGGILVAEIVSDIIEIHREQIDKSKISIKLEILAEPEIEAPDAIISLLINNLIQNAIRYAPEGEIIVVLNENSLCVTDTGIGIPQADINKIFDRGYRGNNVSTQGSGLGLALVQRICDHFHWTISISSDNTEGAIVLWTFHKPVVS